MSIGWTTLLLLVSGLASAGMYAASLHAARNTDAQHEQARLYISSPVWEHFDDRGRPGNTLLAERLEDWPDADGARLYQPLIRSSADHRRPWRAHAEEGRIDELNQTLLLQRKVALKRQLAEKEMRIETEQLLIDQVNNTASTAEPVSIHSGSWVIRAVGLQTDMAGRQLNLLGQVESYHE